MKIIRVVLFCLIITFIVPVPSPAQKGSFLIRSEKRAREARRSADVYFDKQQYDKAFELYRKTLNNSLFDSHSRFRAGLCLYYTSQDSLALIEFEKTRLLLDENGILNFYLARCYHLTYNFNTAIDYYRLELNRAKNESDTIYAGKLEKYIAECQSGTELILNKKDNISINTLPCTINSAWSDYAAFITDDGALTFFNSGRPLKEKDEFDDNIYNSVKDTACWNEALVIDFPVNTGRISAVAGLSSFNGLKIYTWSDVNNGDLYFSGYDGTMWSRSAPLPGMINSPAEESSICITVSGDTAFFVSNRPGGTGGKDIYYSIRENDQWTDPVNIGEIINTAFDEESVFFKDNTLYFSSKGHDSMGGYDIFRSIRSGNKWSKPENAGYPVNSPYDDLFYYSAGGHTVFSSDRQGGFGKSDIYLITTLQLQSP
ncbi:MAG TPA: tetratricopeptide repeat protein [Bacteroidales bacterium]|nr:tetratricopeptide repeat protein [Bacteroidales bacterium]